MKGKEVYLDYLHHDTQTNTNCCGIVSGTNRLAFNGECQLTIKNEELLEKDLEVLKILKRIKWDVYENGGDDDWHWFIDTKQSMKITKEEANKIKEWLNDK